MKPANVSWKQLLAFAVPALTAEQVLTEALRIVPDDTLLVHGADGATGELLADLPALGFLSFSVPYAPCVAGG